MLNIGFVIYSKSQVNSFLKSGVIADLHELSNLTVFYQDINLVEDVFTSVKLKKLPKFSILLKKISSLVQMAALWKFKDRSMNQTVRAYASFGSKSQRAKWNCVVVSEMNISWIKRILIRLLSHSFFFSFLKLIELALRFIFTRIQFREYLKDLDLLIIPFSGHVAMDFGSYVWLARKMKIKSLALQENWDNLSTKTFILEEPDLFGVWGEQSRGHVRSVHRLFKTKTYIVGSPRFDPYYSQARNTPMVSLIDNSEAEVFQPYILMAGTGDGADDLLLIEEIFRAIKNLKNSKVKLVYRPHPQTRTVQDYFGMQVKYPEIIIDGGGKSKNFGHQIPLVQNCTLLINHFSTLSLEGLIAGVTVIVPLYIGRTSAKYRYSHIVNEWHHMMGVGLLGKLIMPKSSEEFNTVLQIELDKISSEIKFPTSIDWICQKSNYTAELYKIIESEL